MHETGCIRIACRRNMIHPPDQSRRNRPALFSESKARLPCSDASTQTDSGDLTLPDSDAFAAHPARPAKPAFASEKGRRQNMAVSQAGNRRRQNPAVRFFCLSSASRDCFSGLGGWGKHPTSPVWFALYNERPANSDGSRTGSMADCRPVLSRLYAGSKTYANKNTFAGIAQ